MREIAKEYLDPPDTMEGRYLYSGFWRRVGATIIDTLILLIPVSIAVLVIDSRYFDYSILEGSRFCPSTSVIMASLVTPIVWLMYHAILESSYGQATWGKRILKLVVADLRGERLSFMRAMIRAWPHYLAGFAITADMIFGLNIIAIVISVIGLVSCFVVAFTTRKQGLHDMMTECCVLHREEYRTWYNAKFQVTS